MADNEAVLLDTNILLRSGKSDDPHYLAIRAALVNLSRRGFQLCYTSQTMSEFWNASTRPRDRNGFGLSIAETDLIARDIEREYLFLPDGEAVHQRWRSIVVTHQVKGIQVYDARLAASMYVHNIGQLLTINVQDFKRYPDLRILHPADVGRGGQ